MGSNFLGEVHMKDKNRFKILDSASLAVENREEVYGKPQRNFDKTAELFNVILKDKLKDEHTISAADVVLLMLQVKTARLINQPDHRDSQVDLAGYASLLSEVA